MGNGLVSAIDGLQERYIPLVPEQPPSVNGGTCWPMPAGEMVRRWIAL